MSNPQPPNQLNQLEQGRLAALYRVSQALGASLDLDEVLTQVMDSVISLTGAERGFLVLTEPGGTEWQLRAARNFSRESLQLKDMAVSRTAINTVIQSRAGLVTTDAQTDPRFSEHESVIFHALRSILCAPLLARGQAIGAIYVDNRAQAGLFTEPDLQLLSAFASQAAIAIQNAALYTRTDQALAQRVAELETLARVDAELNASLELPRVLELTCQWALDGGQAQQAWVWLDAPAGSDQPAVTHPQPTDADGEALARQAAAARRPQAAKSPAGQRLAIPLLHGGTALGALLVERAAPAAPAGAAEAAFLERLAGRAASAIQNARLYAEVQQANQAKSKFVSVVTHELRIPMTSIKGYADLLKAGVVGPLNEQQMSFVMVIRSNVERMSALVSDLADISRIETGRLRLDCRQIELRGYIEEALRTLAQRAVEKEQVLSSEIPADLPAVYADHNRVVQILNNLLGNACKYTPRGGTIHLSAARDGERVLVSVRDSGIGISEADQQKLFSQFFRSEDAAVREEQGWGLGLSVAQRLAQVMGGEMGFSSQLGQGSTFWFSLPMDENRCSA